MSKALVDWDVVGRYRMAVMLRGWWEFLERPVKEICRSRVVRVVSGEETRLTKSGSGWKSR